MLQAEISSVSSVGLHIVGNNVSEDVQCLHIQGFATKLLNTHRILRRFFHTLHVRVCGMPARLHRLAPSLENSAGDAASFEQVVDVFELQTFCLGEETVHDRDPEEIEDLPILLVSGLYE